MATNERYVSLQADIKVQRSRSKLRRRSLFSLFHGYLHPVGSPIEVLPGDTFKGDCSILTRMSTPIVPIMDNIRQEVDAFFVPKRILWNKTKQFYGEAPSFGIATAVTEPHFLPTSSGFRCASVADLTTNLLKSESFAAAFGLVYDSATGSDKLRVNANTIRSFLSVYNEFYRDENYQDQYSWNKDQSGAQNVLASKDGSNIVRTTLLPLVNKDPDVVTSVLPWQQKGNPVQLTIAGQAPVIAVGDQSGIPLLYSSVFLQSNLSDHNAETFKVGAKNSLGNFLSMSTEIDGSDGTYNQGVINGPSGASGEVNLYADLSQAYAGTLAEFQYALAYQDFLARAAHFGTRYREYIYGMFGTHIADATEDIPEYLGSCKLSINVTQVVQTTGFASSASTELGALGAYSVSGRSGHMFTKSFTEPGYIVFVTYTKHQRTYSSGIDPVFRKTTLLDYYQPPLANIADVPFSSYDVWLAKDSTDLGFQEPWYDYRAFQDRVYGMMNPRIDTLGEIWTLAEKWTSKPTISAAFLQEDRDAIARCLSTGINGPDYICDVVLDFDATRVMPIMSRPLGSM